MGIADARFTMLYVLISFAVVAATFDNAKARKRWEMMAQRMFLEARQQHLAQFLNARFVLRIANVDNFAVAAISRIFDNAV